MPRTRASDRRAVSGPGRLSARTDLQYPAGGEYGQRQRLAAQQAAAPIAEGPPGSAGQPLSAQAALPSRAPVDVFGPTARPHEPGTLGNQPPTTAPDPTVGDGLSLLRHMYSVNPDPYLWDLIRASGG